MRTIYLLINLLLLTAAGCLIAAHLKYAPAPRDKILRWIPPIQSEAQSVQKKPEKVPQTGAIRSKNIFSPQRGQEQKEEKSETNLRTAIPKFELVGICCIGEQSGAIIEMQDARFQGKDSKKKRCYFALGEEVQAGYRLEKVTEENVILKRNHEILELKITRSRFGKDTKKIQNTQPVQTSGMSPSHPLVRNNILRTAQPGVLAP